MNHKARLLKGIERRILNAKTIGKLLALFQFRREVIDGIL